MSVPSSHFKLIPLHDIISPEKIGPLMVYKDYWWAVTPDRNVFVYTGVKARSNSPQCNRDRRIVEIALDLPFEFTVELLPWAYLQFRLSEYT